MAKKTGVEEEQALVIRGDDPSGTADTIAAIQTLQKGRWQFKVEPDQFITDTYINTENRDLKGSSMRIRDINGEKTLVTIKGKNKNKGTSLPASRSELEVEWPWTEVSVWQVANLFGMEVIQERETHRRVRNVYSGKKLVAELAIDAVTYNFSEDYKVTFFEVEVENKRKDKWSDVSQIIDALKKKYPELKKWNASKLSTGSLLRIALGIEIDEDGVVTDSSFDNLQTLFELI